MRFRRFLMTCWVLLFCVCVSAAGLADSEGRPGDAPVQPQGRISDGRTLHEQRRGELAGQPGTSRPPSIDNQLARWAAQIAALADREAREIVAARVAREAEFVAAAWDEFQLAKAREAEAWNAGVRCEAALRRVNAAIHRDRRRLAGTGSKAQRAQLDALSQLRMARFDLATAQVRYSQEKARRETAFLKHRAALRRYNSEFARLYRAVYAERKRALQDQLDAFQERLIEKPPGEGDRGISALVEAAIPGSYIWGEPGRRPFGIVTLYADHSVRGFKDRAGQEPHWTLEGQCLLFIYDDGRIPFYPGGDGEHLTTSFEGGATQLMLSRLAEGRPA